MREGLTVLLEGHPDLHVVGWACNGYEAVAVCRKEKPDIVLMDLRMPAMDGIAATRILHSELPGTGIIILTMHTDDQALAAALQTGATGFVAKDSLGPDVLDAIRAVAAGKAYFTAAVQLIFVFNLFWSMKIGKRASANPWEATTLEWSIPSPPPFDNFAGVHPVVNHGAYEYAVPGAPNDFIMQNDPSEVQPHA